MQSKTIYIYIIILWLLITSVAPFAFFVLPMHPGKFAAFFLLVIILILVIIKRKIQNPHPLIIFILLFQIVFYLASAFYHNDTAYINLVIQNIAIIITYFFIIQYIGIETFVKSYLKIIQFMIFMGIIVFFYALFGGKSYNEFEFIDGRPIINYIISFARSPFYIGGGMLIRVCGFFDEPGAFAFFIIQALLLNKIYFNSKKTEILLIFGGLFTMSVAFFISLVLYIVFFYLSIKQKKSFLFIGLFFATAIFFIQVNRDSSVVSHLIYSQTIGRVEGLFKGEEVGEVVSDNRSSLVENALRAFKDAPLMGHGIETVPKKYGYFGANILGPFANNGIIGAFFMFLPFMVFLIYSLNFKKWSFYINDTFKSLVIIFINYLQRPDVTGLLIMLLMIAFFHRIKQNNKIVNNTRFVMR